MSRKILAIFLMSLLSVFVSIPFVFAAEEEDEPEEQH